MKSKNKITVLLLMVVVLLSFAVGSFAWFLRSQRLNTVSLVQMPSEITISGANRSEMTRISLELTTDDSQNGDRVTIRRVFCIESTANFYLEVIRTTNIEGMDIKIFPVQASNSNLSSTTVEDTVKGNDGIKTYYYNPDSSSLSGSYLNAVVNQHGIPIKADNTLHGENYAQCDDYAQCDEVQENAEPLYWRSGEQVFNSSEYSIVDNATDGTKIYYRYYVLQLSWNTSAQETDMVYLLASH